VPTANIETQIELLNKVLCSCNEYLKSLKELIENVGCQG